MAVSRRNKAYWAERSAAQFQANARRGAASSKRVQGAYEKAIANVNKELEAWYARFAGENGVSMLEARKLLTSKELKTFKMNVEEYIARGRAVGSLPEGPAKEAWIKELENVSAKVHVSRLEAMQIRMKQQAELAGGSVDAELSQMAAAVYQDSYYHTAFEVQRGTGVGFEFAQLDTAKINKVLANPWAADGRNFSDRVWGNTRQLVAELDSTLTVGLIQGKSLRDMSAALSERMGVAQSKAARLVTTENAYFSSAGQRDSYKALGVEEYEIVVTLDSHTSAVCQGLDGKKIAVKDLKPGATAPPFHPNCRCTTVPYFNDEFTEGEKRAARDGEDAGYELVPADMTYPEWAEKYAGHYGSAGQGSSLKVLPAGVPYAMEPDSIGGVVKGETMNHEAANGKSVNPNYGKKGYAENCQSCSYVYEMRRRGYDVAAAPYNAESMAALISREMRYGWIEPSTGAYAQYEKLNPFSDKKSLLDALRAGSVPGGRYTLEFYHRKKEFWGEGHVVNVLAEKDGNNGIKVLIYDGQRGILMEKENQILRYFREFDFSRSVDFLRVDNKAMNLKVAGEIIERRDQNG